MTDTYGFQWGPVEVMRAAHIVGRAYVLCVRTPFAEMDIVVSEDGKKITTTKPNMRKAPNKGRE